MSQMIDAYKDTRKCWDGRSGGELRFQAAAQLLSVEFRAKGFDGRTGARSRSYSVCDLHEPCSDARYLHFQH